MNAIAWVIISILVISALSGAWRRWLDYQLKKQFMRDQQDAIGDKVRDIADKFFKEEK